MAERKKKEVKLTIMEKMKGRVWEKEEKKDVLKKKTHCCLSSAALMMLWCVYVCLSDNTKAVSHTWFTSVSW